MIHRRNRAERRDLGARIKAARERAGHSQLTLALALQVDPSNVSRWERGVVAPKGHRWDDIAAALGVTTSELFGHSPDSNGGEEAA